MTLCFFSWFYFLTLIATCTLCVIYVREDDNSNVQVMITWLIWLTWTSLSAARSPKKAIKLNHPLTYSLATVICALHGQKYAALRLAWYRTCYNPSSWPITRFIELYIYILIGPEISIDNWMNCKILIYNPDRYNCAVYASTCVLSHFSIRQVCYIHPQSCILLFFKLKFWVHDLTPRSAVAPRCINAFW